MRISKKRTPNRATSITKTINKAGEEAFSLPVKERFISRVMTTLWKEPRYYGETSNDILTEARSLMETKKGAEFVAKAAIFARENMYLRTTPTVLLGELATCEYGREILRRTAPRVIRRADQIKEFVSWLNQTSPKIVKSARQVRLALADSLNTFDEYQLAKYNGRSGDIKFKDIITIVHPKPKDEKQAVLFGKVLSDELAIPKTWETEVSDKGNTASTWDKLITNKSLGYMAALRNLRNIAESGAKKLPEVLTFISNPFEVRKSKQFPYRFFSAYREIEKSNISQLNKQKILEAIETALEASVDNIPSLHGDSFMAADNSGSMSWSNVSNKSTINLKEIANLMQAMFAIKGNSITSVFGDTFATVTYNKKRGIFGNMEAFMKTPVGASTNGHLAIEYLIKNKIKVDRIVIFTDCEIWNSNQCGNPISSYCEKYRKINPKCWFHIVNLAAYGTTPVVGNRVTQISGFSDNIFQYINAIETGETTFVKEIDKIEI